MTAQDTDRAAGGTALARCVSCSAETFASENWGRAPRLTRAGELTALFTDLLDAAAVDELVSQRGLRTPFLRMAKNGSVLAATHFTRGGGAGALIADQVADDKVLSALADGATLVLQALHRTWPPLIDFGTRLAGELGHPVQINAYVTPSGSQGFAPHYDVHDVFVLQIAGSKHWTIHAPVVADPLDDQPWENYRAQVTRRAGEAPLIDTVLEPGDTLYLPRGTIHAARAQTDTSIHLTVGVHPLTRQHVVRQLLELVRDDPALRRSLPMGADLADPAVLAPELAATLSALEARLAAVPAAEVAERLGSALMQRTRPQPVGPLAQLALADALTGATRLRWRPESRVRCEDAPAGMRLVTLDRTVTMPAAAREAVKIALASTSFAPHDLAGLGAAEQLTLARRLVREGLLVADPSAPDD